MNKNNFYRPEIDGLRAISVLSVLIYHLEISINHRVFSGGFLGVDIFFVISGYLITKILLIDLESKTFSYFDFIKRRIRRILPVLFVVILLSTIGAWFILLPSSLTNFSKSVIYTVFFNSNFFFWHDIFLKYSHEQAQLYPLLHTWSLAIEEQYYLIFPIVLLILIKFLKEFKLLILSLTAIISLTLSQIFVFKYPSFAFYLLPFRVWEILVGSICAYLILYMNDHIYKKNFIALIGLILVLLSFLLFNKDTPHPSIYTLVPILGVSLIILFYNKSKKNWFTRIMTSNPMVKLGLISYSLYLIHFPIFSLSRRILNFENYDVKIMLIIISLIVSFILFKFIEIPLRKKNFNFKIVSFICIFLLLIIFGINFSIIRNEGYIKRLGLNSFQERSILKKDNPIIENYNFDKSDIVIIGNSHAIDFERILINTDTFANKNVSRLNIQLFCLKETIQKNYLACERSFNMKKKKIFEKQIKLFNNAENIILKTRWSNEDISALEENLDYLKNLNKKILIIGPNPEFSWSSSEINLNILQNQLYKNSQPFDQFILENNRYPNTKEIEELKKIYFNLLNLEEILEKNEEIKNIANKNKIDYLNFFELICSEKEKKCDFMDSSLNKIYRTHQGHFKQDNLDYFSALIKNSKYFKNLINQ
jgi:peptidoglycan/LPS O-acetylase OafA/YrhL